MCIYYITMLFIQTYISLSVSAICYLRNNIMFFSRRQIFSSLFRRVVCICVRYITNNAVRTRDEQRYSYTIKFRLYRGSRSSAAVLCNIIYKYIFCATHIELFSLSLCERRGRSFHTLVEVCVIWTFGKINDREQR